MTQNADIRRHYEGIAKQYHQLRRRLEKVENAPADLRNAAIDGGKGLLVKSGDGTVRLGDTGIEHQGGPAPQQPEAPFVDAGGETVKVQHSGLDVNESPAPANFRRAQVHVSPAETFEPSLSTLAGYMDAPDGSMTHRLPGGEWYVGVVWETRSGKLSDLSETVLADVAPLVDADEIQEALDEAADRLAEAEQDFQEGNEARKQEIENLRDNVIPGLRESLNDKADQSALDDLDDKLDNIDIPDLSGVPTKDQVDEAVKAAEQAAKEHADLVSKGAKDDAIAEAEAKANAAKEAAEQAAKDYTDQAKADAAADAQEKADAAREHADKLVGELDFSDFAHVWRQDDPPPAGTTYEWTDGAHASPSVKRVDGEVVARNLIDNPSFEKSAVRPYNDSHAIERTGERSRFGDYSVRAYAVERYNRLGVRFINASATTGTYAASAYFYIPSSNSSDSTRVRFQLGTYATEFYDEVLLDQWFKAVVTFELSDEYTNTFYIGVENSGAEPGDEVFVDGVQVAVAGTEQDALAQVEEYFDGDTPDEREKDLWIDKAGLPHFWKKGWGWAVLDDERISKALNDADKAQKTADEAHSEAGEAKNQANAAMDRAGAAEDYADGLPKVLHGTSAPSGTAPDGSVWFQHDGSLSGAVVGQWNMTDGSWQSTPIDSEAIANLDVGKLTAGSADLAEAVVGKIWGQLGVFDRLDAREGWVGGVALEDGAVGAEQVNVEQLFSDEAVINKVWSDIVRARMLTAEEAFIGGALIKENTIDVAKLNVTEELTAAIAQFLEIEAGMIKANAFEGGTFTGGTFEGSRFETHSDPNQGVKMLPAGLIGYNTDGDASFFVDSASGEVSLASEEFGVQTIVSGGGIESWHIRHESPYPDPTGSDPELTSQRLDDNGSYTFTDGSGSTRRVLRGSQAITVKMRKRSGAIGANLRVWLWAPYDTMRYGAIKWLDSMNDLEYTWHASEGDTTPPLGGLKVDWHSDNASSSPVDNPWDLVELLEVSVTPWITERATPIMQLGSSAEPSLAFYQGRDYPDPYLADEALAGDRISLGQAAGSSLSSLYYQFTDATGSAVVLDADAETYSLRLSRKPDAPSVGIRVQAILASEDPWGSSHRLTGTLATMRADQEVFDYTSNGAWDYGEGLSGFLVTALESRSSLDVLDYVTLERVNVDYIDVPANPTVDLSGQGLTVWDNSGTEIVSLGGPGENYLTGRMYTNLPGEAGAILSEDRGPEYTQGAGIWFADDGTTGEDQAAIWAQSEIGSAPYTEYDVLNVRAPSGGNVRHRSRSYFNELVDFDGHVNVWGTHYIRGGISIQIDRTTSYNANLYLDRYGLMYKTSSASRYKLDQQVLDISDEILDLELKDWIDKAQVTRRKAAEEKLANLGPDDTLTEEDAADLDNSIGRIPGVVAEDVEAIDDRFVIYDDDGEVENVMYDRLALTWIPIVRRQRDRITALEEQNAGLEARLARLEEKLS